MAKRRPPPPPTMDLCNLWVGKLASGDDVLIRSFARSFVRSRRRRGPYIRTSILTLARMRIGARRTKGWKKGEGKMEKEKGNGKRRRARSIDTFEFWRQFWRNHPRVSRLRGKRKRKRATRRPLPLPRRRRSRKLYAKLLRRKLFRMGFTEMEERDGRADGRGRTDRPDIWKEWMPPPLPPPLPPPPPTAKVFQRHSNQLLGESTFDGLTGSMNRHACACASPSSTSELKKRVSSRTDRATVTLQPCFLRWGTEHQRRSRRPS